MDLVELAKLETQQDPPLGEAKGAWRCSCGEEITWTRAPIMVPTGRSPKKYAAQEHAAFLGAVAVEVQKHQRTHARPS